MDQPQSLKALSGWGTGRLGRLLGNFVDFGCLALYFKGLTQSADLHRNTSLIVCLDRGGSACPWNSSPTLILPQRTRVILYIRLAELIPDIFGACSHRDIDFAVIDGPLCEVCGCRNVCDLCSSGGRKDLLEFFPGDMDTALKEVLRWLHVTPSELAWQLLYTTLYLWCVLLEGLLARIIIRWLLMENVYCSSWKVLFSARKLISPMSRDSRCRGRPVSRLLSWHQNHGYLNTGWTGTHFGSTH